MEGGEGGALCIVLDDDRIAKRIWLRKLWHPELVLLSPPAKDKALDASTVRGLDEGLGRLVCRQES